MRSHLLVKLILATTVAARVPPAPEPVERPKGLDFGTRGEPPHQPPPPCHEGHECPHPPPPPCHEGHCEEHYVHPIPPPPPHPCPPEHPCPLPHPPPEDCDEWGNPIIKVEIIECPPDKLDCPWRDHGEKHPHPPPPPPYDCPEECKPEHCVYHPEGFHPPPCHPGGKCLPPCPPHCPPPPPPPPCHDGHCDEHHVHPYPPPPPYDCPEECKPEHCVYHPEGFHPQPCPPGGKCLPPCPSHCPPPPPPPYDHEKYPHCDEKCLVECHPEKCTFHPEGLPHPPCPPGGKCLPPCPPTCPPLPPYHHGEYPHPECRPEICIIVIEGEEPHYEPGKEHLPHCPTFCKDQHPHDQKHPYPPPQEECPPECKPEICIIVIEGEEPHYESGKEHLPHCPKHCEKYHGLLPLPVSPPSGPGGYGPPSPPSSGGQPQEQGQSQSQGGLTPVPAPGGNASPGDRPSVVPVSGAIERGYGGFYLGMVAVFVAAVWF